jgi:hypothetical protein
MTSERAGSVEDISILPALMVPSLMQLLSSPRPIAQLIRFFCATMRPSVLMTPPLAASEMWRGRWRRTTSSCQFDRRELAALNSRVEASSPTRVFPRPRMRPSPDRSCGDRRDLRPPQRRGIWWAPCRESHLVDDRTHDDHAWIQCATGLSRDRQPNLRQPTPLRWIIASAWELNSRGASVLRPYVELPPFAFRRRSPMRSLSSVVARTSRRGDTLARPCC